MWRRACLEGIGARVPPRRRDRAAGRHRGASRCRPRRAARARRRRRIERRFQQPSVALRIRRRLERPRQPQRRRLPSSDTVSPRRTTARHRTAPSCAAAGDAGVRRGNPGRAAASNGTAAAYAPRSFGGGVERQAPSAAPRAAEPSPRSDGDGGPRGGSGRAGPATGGGTGQAVGRAVGSLAGSLHAETASQESRLNAPGMKVQSKQANRRFA